MRLYITGNPASGKTTLAYKISKKTGISIYNLDDIFWKKKYIKQYSEEEKIKRVEKIIISDNWIIEGSNNEKFIEILLQKADKIILIKASIFFVNLIRIIKRSIKRKIINKNNNETFISIINMIFWTLKNNYQKNYEKFIFPYLEKTIIIDHRINKNIKFIYEILEI